ncbi:hypothetical protein QJQ45_016444, partial [Haematococcus lacustris]
MVLEAKQLAEQLNKGQDKRLVVFLKYWHARSVVRQDRQSNNWTTGPGHWTSTLLTAALSAKKELALADSDVPSTGSIWSLHVATGRHHTAPDAIALLEITGGEISSSGAFAVTRCADIPQGSPTSTLCGQLLEDASSIALQHLSYSKQQAQILVATAISQRAVLATLRREDSLRQERSAVGSEQATGSAWSALGLKAAEHVVEVCAHHISDVWANATEAAATHSSITSCTFLVHGRLLASSMQACEWTGSESSAVCVWSLLTPSAGSSSFPFPIPSTPLVDAVVEAARKATATTGSELPLTSLAGKAQEYLTKHTARQPWHAALYASPSSHQQGTRR